MNLEEILAGFSRRLGRKPQTSPLTRQDALLVRPVRNPGLEWTEENGLVLVKLVRRKDLWGRIMAGFLDIPESRQLQLDEVGTFVWRLCDGQHTVNDLIVAMCEEHRLSRREVELSLTEFLRLLGKRGMIAVAVPRELVDRLGPERARELGVVDLESVQPPATPDTEAGGDAEPPETDETGPGDSPTGLS